MTTLDHLFDNVSYLAREVEGGDNFDASLKTFLGAVRDLRAYLYNSTHDPVILEHLDYLGEIDLSEPEKPLLQHFLPRPARQMYGRYQHREKIRDEVKQVAARVAVIRRLL